MSDAILAEPSTQKFTNICAEFQPTSVLNSACRSSAVILPEFYVPTFCGFRPVFLHNSVTTLQYKDSTEMSVEFEMQIFRGIVGRHLIAQTRKNQKYAKNVGCRNVAENSAEHCLYNVDWNQCRTRWKSGIL